MDWRSRAAQRLSATRARSASSPIALLSPNEDWHPRCTNPRGGAWMGQPREHLSCIPRCKLSVPAELDSVGLCVYHFTWSVEEACAEMHRQVALRKATVERRAEIAAYVSQSSFL